jgi:hypothetical protein
MRDLGSKDEFREGQIVDAFDFSLGPVEAHVRICHCVEDYTGSQNGHPCPKSLTADYTDENGLRG